MRSALDPTVTEESSPVPPAPRLGAVVGPIIRKFAPKDYLSDANIAELAKCDAVVQCFGDCGTSTSVSVADAVELERRGIPTVTVFSTAFARAARNQAEGRGMRALHLVTVPHPMHTAPRAVVAERADKAVESIVGRLTHEVLEETNGVATLAATAAADDDQELFFERGRTDGLPVVTPTAEKVARMVAAAGRPAEDIIGPIPPRWRKA